MLIGQLLVDNYATAVDAVLQDWHTRWPKLGVLLLLPEAEKDSVPVLQEVFLQRNIPMLGAIFPALLTEQGFSNQGVWLLGFAEMPVHFLLDGLNDGDSSRMSQAASQLLELNAADNQSPALFLIFDGMLPNIASLLNLLHADIGDRANCIGVNAGSETFQPMPCLFDQQQLIGEGVLGLLLPETRGMAVEHGYPVAKSLMNATSTVGNRIDTIDHRPAFEVYQEVILAEYGITLTRDNFYEHAVHFPFGLVTMLDVLVRIPVGVTEDGALFCVGEVPPNTRLKLLRAPELEKSDCIGKICRVLDQPAGRLRDHPLLTFYCAGRRMHFGERAREELAQLQSTSQSSCLFGALTLGEIDSIEELNLTPRFHNAAVVCLKF